MAALLFENVDYSTGRLLKNLNFSSAIASNRELTLRTKKYHCTINFFEVVLGTVADCF